MATLISGDVLLVPIPSSKGTTEINMKLEQAIEDIAKCEVMDMLSSNPRENQGFRKKKGLPSYKAGDIKTVLKRSRSTSKQIILIDNFRVTGAIIDFALRVLPNALYLVMLRQKKCENFNLLNWSKNRYRGGFLIG